jgi:glycosyltransferase involved in cell wall biosynthesis
MNATPLVSVVIPFFNAAGFLHESVASVVSQSYDRWELLLVDDGSTDESGTIARWWVANHPVRMRYLQHINGANRGISASRNLGIRHASGELVAFLDADDVWLKEKLARHVEVLAARPEAGMVYGRTEYWHSWTGNREDRDRDYVPSFGFPANTLVSPPALLTAFLRGTTVVPCPCSVVVRRTLVERLGGFEESFPGLYEDQVFYAKVCLNGPVFVSDECLEKYRQHAGSLYARAEHTDTHAIWRQRYLRWLAQYIAEAGMMDIDLARALRTELWIWGDDSGSRMPFWTQRLLRKAKQALSRLANLVAPSGRHH